MALLAIISPSVLAGAYVVIVALSLLFLFVLDHLNLSYMRGKGDDVPTIFKESITVQTRRKSMAYTEVNTRFGRVHTVFQTAISLVILFSGILPLLDARLGAALGSHPLTHSILFILILSGVPELFDLPFALYDTFRIEARFGFNKMTVPMFWTDTLKAWVVSLIIGLPLIYGVFAFIRFTGEFWWIILYAFIMLFELIVLFIYPVLIAPLFNKFKPLENGELKERLEGLAARTDFTISGIFVMDESKRSSHSNAYFTGFGKFRRIVLYDTLIRQLSVDEIESVLAHEIGHAKKKHILKSLSLASLMLFVGIYLLKIMKEWPLMYQAFHVEKSDHTALFLFMTLFAVVSPLISPLMSVFSRRHEYQADAYACRACGTSKHLISALVNMSEKNLSNVTPHPLYSAYHYSHPTVAERAKAMDKVE